jgi:hypothetical protein
VGNNAAYSTFQHTVITLYDRDKLDLDLLDALAEEHQGTDIDSGGDTGLTANDGKDLEAICIAIVDPGWSPTKSENEEDYDDPDEWEDEELYDKWRNITDKRWGWR